MYIISMGRQPKTGWTRINVRFEDALRARIDKVLPYEGAGDLTSFINLAATRLVDQAEREKPTKRKKI